MSCPLCEICNKICKDFSKARMVFANICLSSVKDDMDLSMITKPANELSCHHGYLCSSIIDFEIVLRMSWYYEK